jgi:hypothetical protein
MSAAEKYLELTWEEKNKVKLKSLEPYRHLFAAPRWIDHTVKKGATVSDTVNFIPQVVKKCAWQVEKYVEQELKGLPLYDACKKLWEFVRFHIEWERDPFGKETIQSPCRLIATGKGDCDCGTTFINTCMYVYGARNITSRITAYNGADNFSHIYTVIPNPKGGEIIIDFCVDKFDYQKPFTKKEDHNMELQFLDGIEENNNAQIGSYSELFGGSDLGELGKLLKRKASGGGGAAPAKKGIFKKSPEKKAAAKEKRKAVGKKALKVVNKVNKINPATVLLRAGILASMKLNVGKVAEKIKWGYATPEYAQSKGMDMSKYDKVRDVLAKSEQIFFAAGGNKENLKKAILTGHGNRNHEVSGFDGYTEGTPLAELLGAIYTDEFVNGMEGFEGFGLEGFGELGEPATAASIAAASTAMGTLAVLLKSIGDLFPNKGKEKPAKEKKGLFKKKQAAPSEPASEEPAESSEPSVEESAPEQENAPAEEPPVQEETPAEVPGASDEPTEVTPSEDVPAEEPSVNSEEGTSGILSGIGSNLAGFYQKNKGWIIPTSIVGVSLLVVGGIYLATRDKEETQKPKQLPASTPVNGPPKKRGRKKKSESLSGVEGVIELM